MALSHVAHGGILASITSNGSITVSGLSAATAGDLVCIIVQWGSSGFTLNTIPATIGWPNGSFVEIDRDETGAFNNGQGGSGRSTIAYGVAAGGETSWAVGTSDSTGRSYCSMDVTVFRGMTSPTIVNAQQTSFGTVGTIPGVIPTAGEEAIIWAPWCLSPNYYPSTVSSGWTLTYGATGGARQTIGTAYRLEASASGTYDGTLSGSVGIESGFIFYTVAFHTGTPPVDDEPGVIIDPIGEIDAEPIQLDTSDIKSWVIRRGSGAEVTGAAEPGSATVVLRNTDDKYNPENGSSPLIAYLRDGTGIWLGINNDGLLTGSDLRGLFAGRITDITVLPMGGPDDAPFVELQCEDALGWYGRTAVYVPFLSGRSHHELRLAILAAAGETRYALANEIRTMPLSGADGNALTALDALNRANGTRHFIKPADNSTDWYDYTTYNRQHGLDGTSDATLAGTDIHAGSGVGWRLAVDTVINAQRATVTPIRFTPNTFTVWEANVLPITVTPERPYTVWVEFDDYVYAPTLDVTRTGDSPTTETLEPYGTRAKITLEQTGVGDATTYTGLTVQGSLARRLPDESWLANDATSQLPPRGIRQGSDIRGDYVGTIPTARGIAEHVVWRYGNPQTRPTLTVKNWMPEQFDLDLGDVLSVTFAEVGATAQLFEIVGIVHRGVYVTPTRAMHETEFVLQKSRVQSDPGWFVLDTSELDSADILAY